MFYYLFGTLEICEPGLAVIDVNGVGYKLTTSLITSELMHSKLGQKIKLFTELAVREDGVELFGFESREERECYNKLITVSGVGPKAAMNILSIMTPDNFALAVCMDDAKAISKANGIGGKTAARIILELKDKISADMAIPAGAKAFAKNITPPLPRTGNLAEAAEALMVLGYDKNSVAKALEGLDPKCDVGELVRLALKTFAR